MAFIDSLIPFVKGLSEASEIVVDENPDYFIAPMMGAVPFIDVMHILNEDFDVSKVHYMPASSHVVDAKSVMSNWMDNFLAKNVAVDSPVKMIGIDEIVSGSSATRVYRAVTQAINRKRRELVSQTLLGFNINDIDTFENAVKQFDRISDSEYFDFLSHIMGARKRGTYSSDQKQLVKDQKQLREIVKNHFNSHISYVSIGIEDSKLGTETRPRQKQYLELRKNGAIIPVSVEAIISMDKPDLCPARYKPLTERQNARGHVCYSPVVENFLVTDSYLTLLEDIAKVSGKNPEKISPVNMRRILESSDFLDEQYKV